MNRQTLEEELQQMKQRIAVLEERRAARLVRAIRRNKRVVIAVACLAFMIPAAIYAAAGVIPYSFTAGSAAVASQVNDNFTYLNKVAVPIGGIIGWHQDLTGVPALPGSGEWVKCDGQTLADADSPMNGQVIPNLNGNGLGANSPGQAAKVAMFLRGGTTSGTGQTDAFQGHWHNIYVDVTGGTGGENRPAFASTSQNTPTSLTQVFKSKEASTDGPNGTPRTANETRPVNMSVVWIMRVK